MQKRRIALVIPGVPHPTQGASSVLFYHYAKAVTDAVAAAGGECLHLLLLAAGARYEATPREYAGFLGQDAAQVRVIEADAPFFRSTPFRHVVHPGCRERTRAALREFAPDLTVCFDLLAAALAGGPGSGRTLAWLGDLNFQTTWYAERYNLKENGRVTLRGLANLAAAGLACRAWKRVYARVLAGADRLIVSSKSSEKAVAALGLHGDYLPYPWPCAEEDLAQQTPPPGPPHFLFFGSLQALGSRSALHFLLDRLHPCLLRRLGPGGFAITIAGRGEMPAWAREALPGKPEFDYLGFVPDLAALMRRCHGVLAPIDVPVGNRSRIITAMAQGVPVIAHENAALSNPELVDGQSCFLIRTADQCAERMIKIANDRETSSKIVQNAQDAYRSLFHPDAACRLFLAEIHKLLPS